jgi:hypothetical protein
MAVIRPDAGYMRNGNAMKNNFPRLLSESLTLLRIGANPSSST